MFAASGVPADVSALRGVTGQVTNAVSGAGAPGVAVRIQDVGDVTTNANGEFILESEALDGRYRVIASGAGVVERQTTLVFPGGHAVLPLIPASFNMLAYDEMVRQFGGGAALKRWLQPPALIVEMSLLDREASIDPSGVPGETAVASAQQQSETAVAEVVDHLTRALPLLTGGAFTAFSAVSRQTTDAGSPVGLDQTGAITVVRYPPAGGQCRGYGLVAYFEDFEVASGRVYLETCSDASLAAHELGHALGYGHVAAAASVMKATVSSFVTDFDRQATAIAYQRPPGNRAPDSDPDAFTVNQPLRAPARGFTTTVGPVP